MKYALFPVMVLLMMLAAARTNETRTSGKNRHSENAGAPYSPIEGNWILVSNNVYGKELHPQRVPQQIKMFNKGVFSFMMYDSAGNFYYAGAGPYEVNGNRYKETFAFASVTNDINSKDWQRWEMKEDTLVFYGFEKGETADGRDVTTAWGKNKFIEKRVRIR